MRSFILQNRTKEPVPILINEFIELYFILMNCRKKFNDFILNDFLHGKNDFILKYIQGRKTIKINRSNE